MLGRVGHYFVFSFVVWTDETEKTTFVYNKHGLSWQGMRDSNPRKRSQSPVCYRYTNPLYSCSGTDPESMIYYTAIFQIVKHFFVKSETFPRYGS